MEEPEYSYLPELQYDWEHTCYGGAKEEIPDDLPEPLGKPVVTTSYVNANMYHDLISGKAVTGILHKFNETPIDSYSKLQATVETATFGTEYIATRTCVEQIIAMRNELRYLGVSVKGSSLMFGDNESVVLTSTVPHSKLSKQHNALAYHKTREAVAAGIVRYYHIHGDQNPADIVSKHWKMAAVWDTLKLLMFYDSRKKDKNEVNPESNSQDQEQTDTRQVKDALVLVKGSERQVTLDKTLSRNTSNGGKRGN